MSKQTTHTVLMVEPTRFGFNPETFKTNSFQNKPEESETLSLQNKALNEFKKFAQDLRNLGVNVQVIRDLENSRTPDSIFPNNWFSTHSSGVICTYPMAVENRRAERREDILDQLKREYQYIQKDFTKFEQDSRYLEGTGSLIFDHDNRVVYAAISPRTEEGLVQEIAELLNYEPIMFHSYGKGGELIYHTNVMMCVGQEFIAIGMDTIDKEDRHQVETALLQSGKEIILLTSEQIHHHFTGNMLQVENKDGERILVLSQTAYQSLNKGQLQHLQDKNDHILPAAIPTIEYIGGGSARCMLAEIFVPN